LGDNWTWRIHPNALTDKLAIRIKEINQLYGRSNLSGPKPPPLPIIDYEES